MTRAAGLIATGSTVFAFTLFLNKVLNKLLRSFYPFLLKACNVFITLILEIKFWKWVHKHIFVVLSIIVVLSLASVDDLLRRDHSKETRLIGRSFAVLLCSIFEVVLGQNLPKRMQGCLKQAEEHVEEKKKKTEKNAEPFQARSTCR